MYELVFVTSNNEKLAHARYICRKYNVFIAKQKNYGIGYKEPRVRDREELFQKSIEDALSRWQKNVSNAEDKIFFIEDTSVNIPLLAKQGEEYPGLDIKYWMREIDFESLDKKLKYKGNDRTAIVRSDVALVFSRALADKFGEFNNFRTFTSQIEGSITEHEKYIQNQPYYCWLNNKTFNKWFVPPGCSDALSSLPISIADKYDFRKGAIEKMLSYLQSKNIISKKQSYLPKLQMSFFLPPIFIITGPTCAGKTTLAEYLVERHNYLHLEASDFMYVRYREHHGISSSIRIADFAEEALMVDPGIVVDQIIRVIKQNPYPSKVITGFRSVNEIQEFIKKTDNEYPIEVIYVEADYHLRYLRNQMRNREQKEISEKYFRTLDEQQYRMGIREIKKYYKDNILENNNSLDNYYQKFLNNYGDRINSDSVKIVKRKYADTPFIKHSLENIIILSIYLTNNSNSYTTTQIAHLIKNTFPNIEKNKNNISRYFNQNYHPYYDISKIKNRTAYKLSQTGVSKAKIILKLMNN